MYYFIFSQCITISSTNEIHVHKVQCTDPIRKKQNILIKCDYHYSQKSSCPFQINNCQSDKERLNNYEVFSVLYKGYLDQNEKSMNSAVPTPFPTL